MEKRYLSRAEVIKVHEILKQHLKKNGDCWEYEQDWDDVRVGKLVGDDVRSHVIGNLRLELFGKIRSPGDSGERYKLLEEKLTKLEQMGQDMIKSINELAVKHKKLCENLSLNRIIDVKHLQ